MTEEEQAFTAARADVRRLFLAFTKAPQSIAYTESKRRVLEAWARRRYPDLRFSAETDGPTWHATSDPDAFDQGTLDFSVSLVTETPLSQERMLKILAEGRAYLASLQPAEKET